ncbi:helix-turn-helix domain-containing protein [Polaribacter sp. Asnod6-C07]|uniref:helix-turn-helix domain-containing protein n=1 Tax=Polaribacter sp. Asnod6-C07 TaxID=3160582 RepID=UPI003864D7D8
MESKKVIFLAYFYPLKIEMKEKEKEKERLVKKSKAILRRIVKRRKELGLTQWDLGALLNLTSSGFYKIETGKTKLDTIRLLEILEKLEISPEEFFKGFK